jgi:hypothetical protein
MPNSGPAQFGACHDLPSCPHLQSRGLSPFGVSSHFPILLCLGESDRCGASTNHALLSALRACPRFPRFVRTCPSFILVLTETSYYEPADLIDDAGFTDFDKFLIAGPNPNLKKIKENVDRSLMLVTAPAPVIGYDKASKIADYAMDNDLTLKAAALKLGFVTEAEFDRVVDAAKMVRPYVATAR